MSTETTVPPSRIRRLNEAERHPQGSFVLYWMTATRRLSWNYALDRALAHARELDRPLLILEPLNVDYPWACDRHHRAIIDGMHEHDQALAGSRIGYYPYVEPEPGAGRGLVRSLAAEACVLITDDSPVFFTPDLLAAAAGFDGCLVEAIDSCGLLPLSVTDGSFASAYQFRRFLQKTLPDHLMAIPSPEGHEAAPIPPLASYPAALTERWPRASSELLAEPDALSALPIDHGIRPADWTGGQASGRARLAAFIEDGLERYADESREPSSGASSRLSPWLHYGHLSAHEVFRAVADAESWTPARLGAKAHGKKSGWWGMSDAAEAFVDELVTWRELGYVYCHHEPEYADYDTLPDWALETLEEHAADPRPHVYTLDELADAGTDDEIWNAAQRQLVEGGIIHNYLRMLWGKRILEWTEHPRDALRIMIELNNRYALDGRDPNSYSGIFWVLGRFDRPWPERAIFGKVRSMTSRSTRRKLDLERYLERWGDQPGLGIGG